MALLNRAFIDVCVAPRKALFIDGEMAINVNSDAIFLFAWLFVAVEKYKLNLYLRVLMAF